MQSAAENLATSLEDLGDSFSNVDPTNPQIPDTASFIDAGEQVQAACD